MSRGGLFASAPDVVEVIPGLYVGAAPSRRGVRAVVKAGVSWAIDLRTDRDAGAVWPSAVRVLRYPLVEYEAPSVAALNDVSRQTASLVNGSEIVFIHCRAGAQRAPLVACAVLMQLGWTIGDAFRLVSSKRPRMALSDAQIKVLKDLAREPRPTQWTASGVQADVS